MDNKIPQKIFLIYESRQGWISKKEGLINTELISKFLAPDSEIEIIRKCIEESGIKTETIDIACTTLSKLKEKINEFGHKSMVWNLSDGFDYFSGSLVPALSTLLEMPFIGSDTYVQALCQKKHHAKSILRSKDIFTSNWLTFSSDCHNNFSSLVKLKLPVFIKPAELDNSIGDEIIEPIQHSYEGVKTAIEKLFNIGITNVLVEELLEGEEITVACVHTDRWKILPMIQHYQSSYMSSRVKVYQEPIKSAEVQLLIDKLIHLLNLKDYFRVDLRRDDKGRLNVIELNTGTFLTTSSFTNVARLLFNGRLDMFRQLILYSYSRQTMDVTQKL